MSDLRDFTGKNRKFTGTGGVVVPQGTEAQRVTDTATMRFNSDTNLMEYYTGSEWKPIDAPPVITGISPTNISGTSATGVKTFSQSGGAAGSSGTYTPDTTTSGSGSGFRASIVQDGSAAAAVTVTDPGTGYAVNDTITMADADIGSPGSNLVLTVTAVNPLTRFTISGASFGVSGSGGSVKFVASNGGLVNTTFISGSGTSLVMDATNSDFSNAQEPYDVQVNNASNLSATLEDQINVDNKPRFTTAAGSLGNLSENASDATHFTIAATDADSDAITFAVTSGSLPGGLSMSSAGAITGTPSDVSSDTTSNFVVTATANSVTATRAFAITVTAAPSGGTISTATVGGTGYVFHKFDAPAGGTFSLPGTKSIDVVIVAGGGGGGESWGDNDTGKGGGGGGAVLARTGYSVTAGQYSITVGAGGDVNQVATGHSAHRGESGGNSTGFGVTAVGGGGGGGSDGNGSGPGSGGSGGGGGARNSTGSYNQGAGSTKNNPSGWSSYGNSGGNSANGNQSGGGGGGAGGSGGNHSGPANGGTGGTGGAGVDLTSIVGTGFGASGFFGGGGGGGSYRHSNSPYQAPGGTGGGGRGIWSQETSSGNNHNSTSLNGTDGTGGGGGGSGEDANRSGRGDSAGDGGKGVVIIRYPA